MSGLQSSGGIMLEFWLCFVPLFVAVDALGTLPIFISLTAGLDRARVRKVLWQSLLTATAVALAFLGVGKGIFALLGITVADFMIAGGSLLIGSGLSWPSAQQKPQRFWNISRSSTPQLPIGFRCCSRPPRARTKSSSSASSAEIELLYKLESKP
jgi:multiple antibiotic resistance protein